MAACAAGCGRQAALGEDICYQCRDEFEYQQWQQLEEQRIRQEEYDEWVQDQYEQARDFRRYGS